jgi:hypothetical protein
MSGTSPLLSISVRGFFAFSAVTGEAFLELFNVVGMVEAMFFGALMGRAAPTGEGDDVTGAFGTPILTWDLTLLRAIFLFGGFMSLPALGLPLL